MQASLRDSLEGLFRYKYHMLLFLVVLEAAIVAYNLIAPDVYESEAKLLVRRGREDVSVDPGVEGGAVSFVQNMDAQTYSELAILKSRELADRVVQELGPERFQRAALLGRNGERAHQKALRSFVDNLRVDVERKSQVISVALAAPDADVAHDALARLVELYEQRHIEVHATKTDPAFFAGQVSQFERELDEAEQRLDEFCRQYGISSLDTQIEALLTQIYDVEAQANDASSRASAAGAQIPVLEEAIVKQSERVELNRTTGLTNWAADEYKKRLADLHSKETDLAARYAADHRPLVELREVIQQLEGTLGAEGDTHTEVTMGLNDNRKQLELDLARQRSELQAQSSRLDVLNAVLATNKEQYDRLATQKVELERLRRDVTIAEDAYRKYRENLEESKISAALDQQAVTNVSVVQAATVPLEPVSPRRTRNVALGLLLGMVGAVGLGFVLEHLKEALCNDSDIQRRLGLPVMTSISEGEFMSCTSNTTT